MGVLGLKGTVLACGDDQGNVKWQTRLPEAGQFWATPVIAGDYLYAFAMDGKCFTVKLGEKGEVVATSELGEGVFGITCDREQRHVCPIGGWALEDLPISLLDHAIERKAKERYPSHLP